MLWFKYYAMLALRKLIIIILFPLTLSCQQMDITFYSWDDFASNFGKEMVSADNVYASMKKSGLKDFTYSKFDYHFVFNDKKKLEALNNFILDHYDYKFMGFTMFGGPYEL